MGRAGARAVFLMALIVVLAFTTRMSFAEDPFTWSRLPEYEPPVDPRGLGENFFVAPDGLPTNAGTWESPWDIESAIGGSQEVPPGSTIWLLAGVYRHPRRTGGFGFSLGGLRGTEERPIHVSAWPGSRVTLDGGLHDGNPLEHVWVWDLEILTTETGTRSRYTDRPIEEIEWGFPWGGLRLETARSCKFINLVIHDNVGSGVGFWRGAVDCELHGCLIYDNGWSGPHGDQAHAVYTQNKEGTKVISGCVLHTHRKYGGFTMRAYGGKAAFVENYVFEENVAFHDRSRTGAPFLVGGGEIDRNIRVLRNFLYKCRGLEIGPYATGPNEDCYVVGNVVVDGVIRIAQYRELELVGNAIVRGELLVDPPEKITEEGNRINATPPARASVFVLPSRYDPRRAHVVVLNWQNEATVELRLSPFLATGRFRLMDPLDFHGGPLFAGECEDGVVRVPVKGEFAVFVLVKDQDAPSPNGAALARALEKKAPYAAYRLWRQLSATTTDLEASREASARVEALGAGPQVRRELDAESSRAAIERSTRRFRSHLAGRFVEGELGLVSTSTLKGLIRRCDKLTEAYGGTEAARRASLLSGALERLGREKKAHPIRLEIEEMNAHLFALAQGEDPTGVAFVKAHVQAVLKIRKACAELISRFPDTFAARAVKDISEEFDPAWQTTGRLEELEVRYEEEKNEEYEVRLRTVEAIAKIPTDEAVEFLAWIARHGPDEFMNIQAAAVRLIARMDAPSAFRTLLTLYEEVEGLRSYVLSGIRKSRREEPLPEDLLERTLSGPDEGSRLELIYYLADRKDDRFVPEAARFAEDFPWRSSSLIGPLAGKGTADAAGILLRIYDHTRQEDRRLVPPLFGRGGPKVLALVTEAIRKKEDPGFTNAVRIAAAARISLAEPAILEAMSRAPVQMQVLLLDALGQIGATTEAGRRTVLTALESREPALLVAAVRAFRTAPVKEAIPILIAMLKRADGILRGELRVTLERVTGQQFGDRRDLWKAWWREYGEGFSVGDVRWTAPEAVDIDLVNLAIEKGVAALRGRRGKAIPWEYESYPVGTTALVVLALRAAGLDRKDPDVKAGVRYLLGQEVPGRTYELAIEAMALAAVDPKRHAGRIAACAERLVTMQDERGFWGYPKSRESGDNSNTQYAVLGLRAAAKAGVPVPRETWRAVGDHFLRNQGDDGGWGYETKKRGSSYSSMTAAGISSLLIVLENAELSEDERQRLQGAIDRGFDALGGLMSLEEDSLYALYGIERAGILGGRTSMGKKAWYSPGARRLLKEQQPDGTWLGEYGPSVQIAYAILFLKKATVPVATK